MTSRRQLRFNVQNSPGKFYEMCFLRTIPCNFPKTCYNLRYKEGVQSGNHPAGDFLTKTRVQDTVLFLSMVVDKFLEHPEGDRTVTNISKGISNMNEFMNERPHFI